MGDGYELDDVGAAWSQGKAIAELHGDALEYGSKLKTAMDNASVGTQPDGAGSKLKEALGDAGQHLNKNSDDLADEAENLGDSIVKGAEEAADTNNEGTQAANAHIMGLSRTVNELLPF